MDKQTLRQYRAIIREINHLEAERQAIIARQQAPPPAEGLPRGQGKSDPTGNSGSSLADLAAQIDDLLNFLVSRRREIEAAIASLNHEERDLLRLRYIQGLSWPNVCARIYGDRDDFYDRFDSYLRRVTRMHGRALQHLQCP